MRAPRSASSHTRRGAPFAPTHRAGLPVNLIRGRPITPSQQYVHDDVVRAPMCAVPHRSAAEQETRHGCNRRRTTTTGVQIPLPLRAARAGCCRGPRGLRRARACRPGRPAVPARQRRPSGRGHHPRPRPLADVPRHPGAPWQVEPDRLRGPRPSVGRHRGGDAAANRDRRLPLRARHAGARSRDRYRAGASRPRALARARARRSIVGDRRRGRDLALSEDRVQDVRGVPALLRHRRRRGHRPAGAARAARRQRGGAAIRAGLSNRPSRRASR
jgi:hypothetical protein